MNMLMLQQTEKVMPDPRGENVAPRRGGADQMSALHPGIETLPEKFPEAAISLPPEEMRPPVFVMNLYYTGIGIARNLRGRGVKVYGLSSEKKAPGARSHFFDGLYEIPDGRNEPEALCQRLLTIRDRHRGAPVIFPTRDFDVLFLHQYRDRLSPAYAIAQPNGSVIPLLLDKFDLAQLALANGIATPQTIICHSAENFDQQIKALRFPLVAKPRFAYQWRREGVWKKVGARKAILIESLAQLENEYSQLGQVTDELLVQEYIPGGDSDIVVCCCYINQSGELLGYFTGRKLRQSPAFFGTGCLVEACSIPEIVAPSVKLLRACGYAGLAEIEFKYDASIQTYFLIEVNPRHWDQHELGVPIGINLTWIAYQAAIGFPPRPQTPVYNGPLKWIAERELLLLFMKNTYNEMAAQREAKKRQQAVGSPGYRQAFKKTLAEFKALLGGHKIFAIWRAHDPIPGALLLLRLINEFLRIGAKQALRIFFRPQHAE